MDPAKLHSWELVKRLTVGIETELEPWPDIVDDYQEEDLVNLNAEEVVHVPPHTMKLIDGFDVVDVKSFNIFQWVKYSSVGAEQSESIKADVDSGQYHPVWTCRSDELECDCSKWRLRECLAHMRAHPDSLDPGDLRIF